jgi:hypothetical protein
MARRLQRGSRWRSVMKRLTLCTVAASVVLPVGLAYAGFKFSAEVELVRDDAGNVIQATGNLADAFNSDDPNQLIGCGEFTVAPIGFCHAQDATDQASGSVMCFTEDPATILKIRAIKSDSFIAFGVDPGTGDCRGLHVSTQSFYRPKATQKDKGRGRE